MANKARRFGLANSGCGLCESVLCPLLLPAVALPVRTQGGAAPLSAPGSSMEVYLPPRKRTADGVMAPLSAGVACRESLTNGC